MTKSTYSPEIKERAVCNDPVNKVDPDGKLAHIPRVLTFAESLIMKEATKQIVKQEIKLEVKKEAKDTAQKGLPKNPDELFKKGYTETSHEKAKEAGIRTFENSKTGDKVRFEQGKDGKPSFEGKDHYHRYNPNSTNKKDQYLDKNGSPCARGCNESHLFPGD